MRRGLWRIHVVFWLVTYIATLWLVLPFATAALGRSVASTAAFMALWVSIGAGAATALLPPILRVLVERSAWRAGITLGIAAAAAVGWAELTHLIRGPLPALIPGADGRFLQTPELGLCVVVFLGWGALVFAAHQTYRARFAHERALALRALAAEARLEALRREVHPHLLFNALNAVIGGIDDNPEQAKTLVRNLSELLRHTMSSSTPGTIDSELRLARLYVDVEKARFEDRLEVTWQIEPGLASHGVPAMVIQPLLENAVKHGLPGDDHVRRITVKVARVEGRVEIEVRNRASLRPARSGAIGLRNLRERLAHEFDGDAECGLVAAGPEVVAFIRLSRRAQ